MCVALLSASPCEAAAGHRRVSTTHGPLHLWWPADYQRESAGVVVYIHGYFTDVDRAWKEHRLATQFQHSGLNALFVACEAPSGLRAPVRWSSLSELLEVVGTHVPGGLPDGRVTAIGHSGAHRTIRQWLEDPQLDTIVLVDALYGNVDEVRAWLDADPSHRLLNVAALTRQWSDELAAAVPDTVVFETLPPPGSGEMRAARSARAIYVRSNADHMGLVKDGEAIPQLLRALQLPLVADVREASDAV
jgi:hypothetical protein